jgi:putative hydrolase of the HAD superfamily
MLQNVKNIFFDLGNVILNIDYNLTQKAFADLGITDVKATYSSTQQSSLFNNLETGIINEEEFVKEILSIAPKQVTHTQVINAWNAMILDFPIRRLQILQQLQLHYNLFLLSNTNVIHETYFNNLLQQTCGYPSLAIFFDKVYLSHRIGMRKPNDDIYNFVLKENGFKPEETLFIDDLVKNIETAKKLGWQTIHLTNGMTIEKDIFKLK